MINTKEYIHYLNRNRKLSRKRYISLYRTIFKNKCKRILEVGTYNGENALQMIQTAGIRCPVREIEYFGFDLFELLTDKQLQSEASLRPPCISEVRRKLESTGAQITLYQGDTKDILPKIKDKLGQVDFIFIDGGHSVETISSDWNCIKDILTEKTVVIFDDYYTNASRELNGVGCQNIINNLSKDLYETELLNPMDTHFREWGKLEINFVKVTKKYWKSSQGFLSDILVTIEPTLQKFFFFISFLRRLFTLSKIKKAIKNPIQVVPYFLQLAKKVQAELKRKQVKRIGKNGEIFYLYKGDLYPGYLNYGNAASFIKDKAGKYCIGKGIDVGASKWPLPGAIPIQNEQHQNAYKLDNFPDGSLDFVFSSHCLEHLEKWQDALKIWIQKLRVNGILFLYLPHKSMRLWNPQGPWVGSNHKWIPSCEVINQFLIENQMLVLEYNPDKDKYWSFYVVAKRIK